MRLFPKKVEWSFNMVPDLICISDVSLCVGQFRTGRVLFGHCGFAV